MLHDIFLIAGLCILFGGLVSWYQTRKFLENCVETMGVVVSHDIQTSYDDDVKTTSSFPIIQFNHPKTGTQYTVRSRVSGHMQEGQEVEILYDPENPNNVKLNRLSHTWMIPILVTFLGVFFSFLGVLVRYSMTSAVSIFDTIIIVFLVIVSVLTIGKYLYIKLN